MQTKHKDQYVNAAMPASLAPRGEAARSALHVVVGNPAPAASQREMATSRQGGIMRWAGLGVLVLLFIASLVYIALGGVLEG
jgi:hypothetical protein